MHTQQQITHIQKYNTFKKLQSTLNKESIDLKKLDIL